MPDSHLPADLTDDTSAHLAEALRAVYGASPTEFMTVRKELAAAAKADGDALGAKAIGALRKPSLAAWAVNLLARSRPELVHELVELGARMRGAQARLDTATLTSLRPERDRVVADVVAAANTVAADAGRPLSASAQDDVRGTAIAALADEDASAAVSSGQLTRALSYSGFGEVDLSEAVVRTSSGSILSVVRDGGAASSRGRGPTAAGQTADPGADPSADPSADQSADRAGDPGTAGAPGPSPEEQLSLAEAELAAAATAHAAAEEVVARAREHADDTRERIAVVERQLAKAREADERALEAVTDAVRARKAAEAARRTAQAEVDRLRTAAGG